jgi:hypothetical protein
MQAANTRHRFATLCDRFEGVDVSCRRSASKHDGWDGPWRARLATSKNERASYRIVVFGQSQLEAEERLVQAVDEVDGSDNRTEPARVVALLDAARDVSCDLMLWERDVNSAPAALRSWAAVQDPPISVEHEQLWNEEDNHVAQSVLRCERGGARISVYLLPKTDVKISGK